MPSIPQTPLAAAVALILCSAGDLGAQGATVSVMGTDYAFQVPDTLDAGPKVFALMNHGAVHHQLLLYLMKEGMTMADYVRATPQERQSTFDELIGVVFANAGRTATGRLGVELQRGRTYLLVCNDRDAADKPTHLQLGMVKIVYVK